VRSTKRIILFVALAVWTILAALGVGIVIARAPVVLNVPNAPLFMSGWFDLGWIWGIGAVALVAAMLPGGWLRRGSWALLAVALGMTAVVSWQRLSSREPRTAEADAAAEHQEQKRTTLLVAVDGMSWTAVLPMVRKGELPHIARLMDEGSYGVLHSLRSYRKKVDRWGYWSPVVWTSVATGVRPPRHGITDFVNPETGHLAASTDRRAAAFWNLFSAFDRRVGVVGWWATWPAEPVSGYVVSSSSGLRGRRSGKPTRSGLTYPEELSRQLGLLDEGPASVTEWVNREIFPFDRYPVLDREKLDTLYTVLWQDRLYLDATRYLIEQRDPVDLYAVYFEGVDALSHHFWKAYVDPGEADVVTLPQGFTEHSKIVPAYYRIVDSYLGKLLDVLPDDVTVLIVSDHGFQLDSDNRTGADHSPYGVLIGRGEGIAQGRSLNLDPLGSLREALSEPTGVLDVLPTLMYLHGLPIAKDLDGHVLGSLFSRRYLKTHPALQVDSYGDFAHDRKVEVVVDPEASKEYQDRLRMLGYIN
jgi:predicted AlkP superfamily phosphohydrolase/phosphomutase